MKKHSHQSWFLLLIVALLLQIGCSTVMSQIDDRLDGGDQDAAATGYHTQEGSPSPGYEDHDATDSEATDQQASDSAATGAHTQYEPSPSLEEETHRAEQDTAEPSSSSPPVEDEHDGDSEGSVFSGPSDMERAMAAEKRARGDQGCERDEGQDHFQFMPLGTYKGQSDSGAGTMTMHDDNTLRINWTVHITGVEKNIHADFKWQQVGIGEILRLCDVQGASSGESMRDLGNSNQAVLGFDEANHSFRVNIPELGEVQFTKTQ